MRTPLSVRYTYIACFVLLCSLLQPFVLREIRDVFGGSVYEAVTRKTLCNTGARILTVLTRVCP